MDSKNPDEILCSSCGRPNLIEAEKCWYCQIPLNKESVADMPTEEKSEAYTDKNQKQNLKVEPTSQNPNENIPEWLKRIRELKEIDQEDSDSLEDKWQQQAFFDGSSEKTSAKSARKTQKKTKSTAHKKQEKISESDRLASLPVLEINKKNEAETKKPQLVKNEKDEIEDSSEELPDGFIEFRSENN